MKWFKAAQIVSGRNQGLNPDLTQSPVLSMPLCLEVKSGIGEREDNKVFFMPR